MAISYANTREIENISKDIIKYVDEFNDEINNLFKRFSDVPLITKEWIGNQAIYYFSKIAKDKQMYIEFANALREVGYRLNKDAYEIQNCILKNQNEES